jgi:transcriptional repressor NrdR
MYGTMGISHSVDYEHGGTKMARMVKKRDGQMEEFIPEKVIVSALKSGASVAVARRIAKDVESQAREETPSEEIRRLVLSKLRQENPALEQNWQTYDRAVKRRSGPETRSP